LHLGETKADFEAQNVNTPTTSQKLQKIILCKSVGSGIRCKYGNKCRFFHLGESSPDVEIPPINTNVYTNKKNIVCKSIGSGIPCKYGINCRFLHF
jgi:hypothetical protein